MLLLWRKVSSKERRFCAANDQTFLICMLRENPVDSLLDTDAFENFISDGIVNTVGLIPNGKSSKVNMASSELSATALGRVTSDLHFKDNVQKPFVWSNT